MIKVIFEDKKPTLTLTIEGHANYAEDGSDIVCSAVSILAHTLAEHAAVLYEKGYITKPDLKIEKGDYFLSCTGDENSFPYLQDKFAFVQLGMDIIKSTFPDNVSVTKLWESVKD